MVVACLLVEIRLEGKLVQRKVYLPACLFVLLGICIPPELCGYDCCFHIFIFNASRPAIFRTRLHERTAHRRKEVVCFTF